MEKRKHTDFTFIALLRHSLRDGENISAAGLELVRKQGPSILELCQIYGTVLSMPSTVERTRQSLNELQRVTPNLDWKQLEGDPRLGNPGTIPALHGAGWRDYPKDMPPVQICQNIGEVGQAYMQDAFSAVKDLARKAHAEATSAVIISHLGVPEGVAHLIEVQEPGHFDGRTKPREIMFKEFEGLKLTYYAPQDRLVVDEYIVR